MAHSKGDAEGSGETIYTDVGWVKPAARGSQVARLLLPLGQN